MDAVDEIDVSMVQYQRAPTDLVGVVEHRDLLNYRQCCCRENCIKLLYGGFRTHSIEHLWIHEREPFSHRL